MLIKIVQNTVEVSLKKAVWHSEMEKSTAGMDEIPSRDKLFLFLYSE